MNTSSTLQELLASGKLINSELIAYRRDLYIHPEISLQESETAAEVADELLKLGLEVKTNVGGHGLFADLSGDRSGRTIRADMDALPIQGETNLVFASKRPGVMHAYGHDAHTSILLDAAKLLVQQKKHLAGKFVLFFSQQHMPQRLRRIVDRIAEAYRCAATLK